MATEVTLLEFFTRVYSDGGIVVKDPPKLDLDLYIANYRGRTRYDRLLHIGRTSVHLCVDALRAAVVEAKQGDDVSNYQAAWDCLRIAAPGDPLARLDEAWVSHTNKENKEKHRMLESQLNGYKNNLVKESIRIGNEDLGQFHEKVGNLQAAQDSYARMRGDIATAHHIVEVGRHLIRVAVLKREWTQALASLNKTYITTGSEDEMSMRSFSAAIKGLCSMGLAKYSEAANSFLDADMSKLLIDSNDILSPNDVAIYGGLLALATMDRTQLQYYVLNNPSFRDFVEHEPHIRKAISLFVSARYSACLAVLHAYKSDYLLDIHLQRHIPVLFSMIRTKCIVQYFVPFSCVSFATLEQEFGAEGQSIEEELVQMIQKKELSNGRLDLAGRYLIDSTPSPRQTVQMKALEIDAKCNTQILESLSNMAAVLAGAEIRDSDHRIVSFERDEMSASSQPRQRLAGRMQSTDDIGV